MKPAVKYFLFTLLLIVVDQAIKLWMYYDVLPNRDGVINIIDGIFQLRYVTNPGMAFGMELGGNYGKLLLTSFRILAMVLIAYYLVTASKKHKNNPTLWALAAILAGAVGNLIDSIFYGVFLPGNLTDSSISPWFHGEVIDMFYANFLDGFWPDWVPILGGSYFHTPIFNFADACIFCGVVAIFIFQKKFLELGDK